MSIKDGDRLPHRRILIYFNVKISQIITTKTYQYLFELSCV